jgi:hypothetical protein
MKIPYVTDAHDGLRAEQSKHTCSRACAIGSGEAIS